MKQIYFALFFIFIAFKINAQIVNIPDDNFKSALLNYFPTIDTNNDGEIQVSEAEALTYLNVENKDISDLTGIEAFINLTTLQVRLNNIVQLDLSNNLNIIDLSCYNNELTNLLLGSNTELIELNCSSNQLTSLDISNAINLVELTVNNNQLTSLDVSNQSNLTYLAAYNNQLSSINTDGAQSLNSLNIGTNQLSQVDLSSNTNLVSLGCGNNQLVELNLDENNSLEELYIQNNSLTNLNISNNINLQYLNCSTNQLANLDVSNNPFLEDIDIKNNIFTNIDNILNNTSSITKIYAENNLISNLDLTNNNSLIYLYLNNNLLTNFIGNNTIERIDLTNNQFTTFDMSEGYESLDRIVLNNNINLNYINLKNGMNNSYLYVNVIGAYDDLDNLTAVCVDDKDGNLANWIQAQNTQTVIFTEYCSFTPGGTYYTIQGDITLDTNSNGCDSEDSSYPQLQLNITDGSNSGAFYGNNQGNYNIPIQAGNYTITPQLENTTYFSVSPNPLSVNFPSDSSPFNQDFCITPNGTFNDVEIVIIPLELAIPGFEPEYKLLYKNKGTTVLSGSINLNFDDNHVDFQSATPSEDTQATGSLSWNYSDLQPFETREVVLSMLLNTPTDPTYPLNSDDILSFTASITSSETDETPEDNTFLLEQVVVNSYDPNDKTCLEGETITLEQVGKYIHYLIRFENNGTANAVNIVVKDIIDETKFDVSTLIPLDSSHDFFTRVQNDNEVEFIFEDIQLPFDDENNDGYILFKIKTLDSLDEGDSFSNEAEIYFDFNFPIITNNETTTIVNGLSTTNYLVDPISIYPNPTNDRLHINAQNNQLTKATITDINGRIVIDEELGNQSKTSINVSSLNPGIYFVNIQTNNGSQTVKMVKQ